MKKLSRILPLLVIVIGVWSQADIDLPMIQGRLKSPGVMAFGSIQIYVKAILAHSKEGPLMKYDVCVAETIKKCHLTLGNRFLKMSEVEELDSRLEKQRVELSEKLFQTAEVKERQQVLSDARLVLKGALHYGPRLIPALNAIQSTLYEGKLRNSKITNLVIWYYH